MTPERWKRLTELFAAALEQESASRAGFVARAAADDPSLADEVLRLLASDEKMGAFLSAAPASPPSLALRESLAGDTPLRGEGESANSQDRGVGAFVDSRTIDSADVTGPRAMPGPIGAYQPVREIGHGGMGAVYLAMRRDREYEKNVAIKLIRRGMESQLAVARFRNERQILAGLQHPNIASLLDGGTTQDGLPYIVMEYIDGEPIDRYCDDRRLSITERLELFLAVAGAVQYAHANLVIHRDLKPGNILVTQDGVPKLLDFGVAKLLDADAAGPEQTATQQRIFTPAYASPEQIRGEPITTASDVYSLGVLLYVLLAGRRPYGSGTSSAEEVARAVLDEEPLKPSTAVLRTPPAESPEGTTERLRRRLAGDLDTIVLKAMRKTPSQRYASVEQLASDVRNHLEGRPVVARADTLFYSAGKFVRRHKAGVAAAGLVALSLVGGMVATARQTRIARANQARAEKRFAEVRKLASWVVFDMHDAIAKLPGATPARKQLVEKALEYLDNLASETSFDPVLLNEIASGYARLGKLQGSPERANLGDRSGAATSLRKAIAVQERLAAASPADSNATARLAGYHAELANLLDGPEALTVLDKVKSILDSVPQTQADETHVLIAWTAYLQRIAERQMDATDLAGLRETRRRQVEIEEKLLSRSESEDQKRSLAVTYKYYGAALHRLKELKPAREFYDKALALEERLVEADPSNPHLKLDLSFSHASVASVLRDEGDFDGALAAYQRAFDLREDVYTADPTNKFAFDSLVKAHQTIADVLARKGDLDGALEHDREALKLRTAWEKSQPSARGGASWLAAFHWAVGDHCRRVALRPGTPAARQRELWRRTREEYSQALAIWLQLARDKPLEGKDAEYPQKLEQGIAECDDAVAKLGGRPH